MWYHTFFYVVPTSNVLRQNYCGDFGLTKRLAGKDNE